MALIRNKLQQVVDELSLDWATGKYLNVISGNYGLHRPAIGFTDAKWRAATKIIALQYKQIANKFRDILELMLGPQVTITSNLLVDSPAGSRKLQMVSVEDVPQAGIVILDAGLATEETLEYKFVDVVSNVITLSSPTSFDHLAVTRNAKSILVSSLAGSSAALVINSEMFPQDFSAGQKHTLVLGPGTPEEEIVQLYGNDITTNVLTISPTLFDHELPEPLPGVTYTTRDYSTSSFSLHIGNLGYLPDEEGVIRLGTAPTILVQYTSRSTTDSTINLKYTIPVEVPAGTLVEFIPPTSVALLGTAVFPGQGWDVIQSWPRRVDILIKRPESVQNLLTASYLHDYFTVHVTNLVNDVAAGDLEIKTVDISNWPTAGTLIIYTGPFIGFDAEYVGYVRTESYDTLRIPFGLKLSHLAGDEVSFYSPTYGELGLDQLESGDIHGPKLYPFPGPYIYSPDELSPKPNVATTLVTNLSASTVLGLDVNVSGGATSIEVEDASAFPESGSFTIQVEDEFMTATRVCLKAYSTVAIAGPSSGTTLNMEVGTIAATHLSLIGGFRILVSSPDDPSLKDEICFVTAVDADANTITIESPLIEPRTFGAFIVPLNDVVNVTQVDEFHQGTIAYANRAPPPASFFIEHELPRQAGVSVSIAYSDIEISSGAGFSAGAGGAILSFGLANQEDLRYSSRTDNILHFETPFVPTKSHLFGEPVNYASQNSTPSDSGYDFPLRVPVDEFDNILYLLDLIRAAGIKVSIIYKR